MYPWLWRADNYCYVKYIKRGVQRLRGVYNPTLGAQSHLLCSDMFHLLSFPEGYSHICWKPAHIQPHSCSDMTPLSWCKPVCTQ